MNHKMGLVKITLGTKSVPTTRTYSTSGTQTADATGWKYTDSSETTSVTASNSFDASCNPYNSSTANYWYIIRGSKTGTIYTKSFRSISTVNTDWEYADVSVDEGKYKNISVNNSYIKRLYYKFIAVFSCTNTCQTFTIPLAGTIQMECWGASGGSNRGLVTDMGNKIDTNGKMDAGVGGLGGYSIGTITYNTKNTQPLFVCVGGKGIQAITRKGATPNVSANGGYNGGGKSFTADTSGDNYMGTGGGATHIATRTGVLSSLNSYQSSVLIVAGGGGGSAYYRNTDRNYHVGLGGHGGGTTAGSARNAYEGIGGALTSPGGGQSASSGSSFIYGTFGQGANMTAAYGSGGGGGWYGGATHNCGWGAGGGSGHIGTGVSGNTYNGDSTNRPTNPGGNDGYAKITLATPANN